MRSEINPKVAIIAIVIVVAMAGIGFWKMAHGKAGTTDEKGIPLVPTEARAGSDALSQLYKTNVQPPKTR